MLVQPHGSPESTAVHRFFHLVHRLGPGAPHQGLIVIAADLERFGPVNGIAVTPQGLCVLAVHGVESGAGLLFAPVRGGWTIGGRPAYVAGSSNPVEAVDRAVKTIVARIRRGGVDPGYVRALIVVDGSISGVAQPEAQRSSGVHVTALEEQPVLDAIAVATAQVDGGLRQMWTTADVIETLDALGLPTSDLDSAALGAEGFPYSPYVLRPTSIDDVPFTRTGIRPGARDSAYESTDPIPSLAGRRELVDLSDDRRRASRWLIPLAVLALVVAGIVVAATMLLGSDEPTSTAGGTGQPTDGGGGSPGVQVLDGHSFTQGGYNVTDNCAAYAYGTVKQMLTTTPCTKMERALYLTEVEGKPVIVTLAQVQMPDAESAAELKKTVDTDGTGNVNALLQDGTVPPGYPDADVLDDGQYASSIDGTVVRIVETAYADGSPATEAIDQAADVALELVIAAG